MQWPRTNVVSNSMATASQPDGLELGFQIGSDLDALAQSANKPTSAQSEEPCFSSSKSVPAPPLSYLQTKVSAFTCEEKAQSRLTNALSNLGRTSGSLTKRSKVGQQSKP
jgi:hypothetical protein